MTSESAGARESTKIRCDMVSISQARDPTHTTHH